jgi:hypothetical protein
MEDLGVDENAILEWILEKEGVKLWTGYITTSLRTCGRIL